jgi:hypothetical protein
VIPGGNLECQRGPIMGELYVVVSVITVVVVGIVVGTVTKLVTVKETV